MRALRLNAKPFLAVLAALGAACSPSPQPSPEAPERARPLASGPSLSSAISSTPAPATSEAATVPASSSEAAAPRTSADAAPAPVPTGSGTSSAASCPPPEPSLKECTAVELTGAPPCELVCHQKRNATPNRCCEGPVDIVITSGGRELLREAACRFVLPECAHVHGHGFMDAQLRVLEGSPPDIVVVEGGCEVRAMMHGYVPPGVAAWTGCEHKRRRWDGKAFVLLKKK